MLNFKLASDDTWVDTSSCKKNRQTPPFLKKIL